MKANFLSFVIFVQRCVKFMNSTNNINKTSSENGSLKLFSQFMVSNFYIKLFSDHQLTQKYFYNKLFIKFTI